MTSQSCKTGAQAEQQALRYLQQQGLKIITRNYHCRRGEIDLILWEGELLLFVEVRYRKSARFGTAAESVTPEKQRRILAAASHYLQRERAVQDVACRFDVVAISGEKAENIHWIKDAFRP